MTTPPPNAAPATPSLGIDIGGTAIKAALLRPDAPPTVAVSDPYERPERAALLAALRQAVERLAPHEATVVGVCAPGRRTAAGDRIELAVNVPGLAGVPFADLAAAALGSAPSRLRVVGDAHAAAADFAHAHRVGGRLFALSLGTGVGACVLEPDGSALRFTNGGSGHWGQIDLGPCAPQAPGENGPHLDTGPIGPDGGLHSAEAFLGLPALRARFGAALERMPAALGPEDQAVLALARLLRIASAVFAPRTIALLGGVGLRLRESLPAVRARFEAHLTSVVHPIPTLAVGDHAHHAALGAARLAAGEHAG